MRRFVTLALVVAGMLIPAVADAGENYVCWYVEKFDPAFSTTTKHMRCRIDGVVRDLGSPGEGGVSVPLVYDIGYDAIGECYYRRSGPWTGWVARGSAGSLMNFWWDPDGIPGGPLVGDAWVEPCTSEPTPGEPPMSFVFQVIGNYPFVDPVPDVVPPGIGLTGAQSLVDVTPPLPVVQSLVSPVSGVAVDIEIKVITVTIRWGDGSEVSIPESQFGLFAAHPDGRVAHMWETKGDYVMEVDYNWFVRWRAGGGPWIVMPVPATSWSAPYQVDEIVGRRSG